MNFTPQELTLIGTLTGAFIGGLFGFLTAWISKRSEERKAFKELIIRVASEKYMHEIDSALKNTGGRLVMPYHVHLVETLQLAKLTNKHFLSKKRIKRLLEKAYRITDVAVEYAKERGKDSPTDSPTK